MTRPIWSRRAGLLSAFCKGFYRSVTKRYRKDTGLEQNTEIYFDPAFAEVLETWAVKNAWREIQVLLGERTGKALDVACGTGRTFDFLKRFKGLEYYGCDISSMLIERAVQRGISSEKLRVMDATVLGYADREFDFLFSIGSLEHFTVEGLRSALTECRRVCRGLNFHMIPVSSSGLDEGWIKPYQAYWNNSQQWWVNIFEETFGYNVWTMSSKWEDDQSRGVWFICGIEDGFVNN
jgi:ubiquinone/menaquinone biosynthesis C-methylase UbiE